MAFLRNESSRGFGCRAVSKVLIGLLFFSAMSACKSETDEVEQSSSAQVAPSPPVDPNSLCTTQVEILNCGGDIPHSIQAEMRKICTAGKWTTTACIPIRCEWGYEIRQAQCEPLNCRPDPSNAVEGDPSVKVPHPYPSASSSSSYSYVDCRTEISNSLVAYRTRRCNSKANGYEYGACQLKSCISGYYASAGQCVPYACTPKSEAGEESCISEIPGASQAVRKRMCNSSGSGYLKTACILRSCEAGYDAVNNGCVPKTCQPNTNQGSVPCANEIPHAISAEKQRVCRADGIGFNYQSCLVKTCESGYSISGNSCIPNLCTPNQFAGTVSCANEIPNSSQASKRKACNAQGTDYDYSLCVLESCNQGFVKNGSFCIAQTCSPGEKLPDMDCKLEVSNSLKAWKTKTCSANGQDYVLGECKAESCQLGYLLVGNQCVAQKCEPNSAQPSVSCSTEIPNSLSAKRSRVCNATGSDFTLGSCELESCQTGYRKQGNSCLAMACTPGASLSAIDCTSEIAHSATASKPRQCDATGSRIETGTCQVGSCQTGYTVSGNTCVVDSGGGRLGSSCVSNYTCDLSYTCISGKCQFKSFTGESCDDSLDCYSTSNVCKGGKCSCGGFACSCGANYDCDAGYTCINGSCNFKSNDGSACDDVSDCSSYSSSCRSGKCCKHAGGYYLFTATECCSGRGRNYACE